MSDIIAIMENKTTSLASAMTDNNSDDFPYPIVTIENQSYALFPARYCLLEKVTVNAKNHKDLMAAIPFALEDSLADQVEDLEFVYSEKKEDSTRHVMVCRKEKIESWLRIFSHRDIIILPDVLALPLKEQCWTVLVVNNRALVRTGLYTGYECDLACLNEQLKLSLAQQKEPDALEIWLPGIDESFPVSEELVAKAQLHQYTGNLNDYLSLNADPVTELGIVANKDNSRQSVTTLKSWLPAMAILMLAFIIYIYSSLQTISAFDSRSEELQADIEALFRESFPDAKRIVNIRVQTEQKLSLLAEQRGGPDSGFFPLFSTSMLAIANVAGMKVTNVNWQQGTLLLQVSAPSVADIETLKEDMGEENYSVEMVNAVSQADGYRAQLKIKASL